MLLLGLAIGLSACRGFFTQAPVAVLDVYVQTPPYTFAFDASGSVGEIDRFVLLFGDGHFIGGDWDTATWPVNHTYPAQTASYVAVLWIEDIYGQDDEDMKTVETPSP